jgi:hypothetical protein
MKRPFSNNAVTNTDFIKAIKLTLAKPVMYSDYFDVEGRITILELRKYLISNSYPVYYNIVGNT